MERSKAPSGLDGFQLSKENGMTQRPIRVMFAAILVTPPHPHWPLRIAQKSPTDRSAANIATTTR